MAGKQGYPLRYARSFDMGGGKRQIILATDRPVSFQEVYSQSQAGDFDVSLIILNLDENGKGSGILSLGTEVTWNDKEGKIEMTNASSQPIKLGDVRPDDGGQAAERGVGRSEQSHHADATPQRDSSDDRQRHGGRVDNGAEPAEASEHKQSGNAVAGGWAESLFNVFIGGGDA